MIERNELHLMTILVSYVEGCRRSSQSHSHIKRWQEFSATKSVRDVEPPSTGAFLKNRRAYPISFPIKTLFLIRLVLLRWSWLLREKKALVDTR